MLFSGGACSRRVSLFLKPFSFPRRCAKLERERERVGSWERAGEFCRRRCFVLFCVECRGRGGKRQKRCKVFLGGNEEKNDFFSIFFSEWRKNLFDFKSRQTNKKTRGGKKHNKKKEEKRQKARALHEVFMLCFVLFKTME